MYNNTETNQLLESLKQQQLKPQAVINTHCHIDHILGVKNITETFKIPFFMHEKELVVLNNAKSSAALFGLVFNDTPSPSGFLKATPNFMLGDDAISILFTPGHSPGSICFYDAVSGWLIGGDVLFQGSIGRTDLPGGHHRTLLNSIEDELMILPDEVIVYPGHGPATTIGNERMNNPFLN
jgi:glyoxylase-like metal-dependent hydrolase (beta-lactamase superfamily II)